MSLGPVEMLVVKFPGNKFSGEIAPALAELVERGTIRVIDILFAYKDADGQINAIEINDLDDDNFAHFDPVVEDLTGLLSEADLEEFGATLEPNSSVGLMLFENTWATRLQDAIVNASGKMVFNERVPKIVIDELLAETSASAA